MKKQPSPELIAKASEHLRALADEARLRMLLRLREGETNVSTIVEEFGLAQASVSKHLAILRQAGFVKVRREGAQSLYSIKDETVFDLFRMVCDGVRRYQAEMSEAIGLNEPNFDI